jgi:hypothetical protein
MPLNSGQRYLNEVWDDILDQLPEEIDMLLLNGDICDGDNPAEMCRNLTEVDPTFQVRAAVTKLEPIAIRCKRKYATRGSTYHTGKGGRADKEVAEALGCIPAADGHYARPWLNTKLGGLRVCAHHNQTTTIRYHSMPLEREISFACEYAGRTGQDPPHISVCSHVHWGFGVWQEAEMMAISTPPMKLQDQYAQGGKYPWRWRPYEIGVTLLRVYPEKVDGFRAHAVPLVYPHPEIGYDD